MAAATVAATALAARAAVRAAATAAVRAAAAMAAVALVAVAMVEAAMAVVEAKAKGKAVAEAQEPPKDRTLPHHSTLRLDLGRRTDVPGMWSHSTR